MALLIGCQSSSVVKKSKSEMLLMEQKALMARQFFDAGDYDSAQEQLVPLCEDRHVNQTLYKCELASSYLLDGEKDKAHRTLLEIHESIEGFFDAESEKKAASLWGKESSKVYKGDPYERGTLYFLLSLSMLERGDVDNALAALKTGLLADSDTEEQTYTADFGLLQLVAAKCYALRGEDEMSDQMLGSAFDSFISVSEISTRFANELKQEYNRKKIRNELVSPPSNLLARLCALASAEKLTLWLQDSGLAQEECVAVAKWAKYSTASMMPLDFNALVIIWNGEAPTMSRAGEYGEKRL
ncbi:MAG: hypothetical protein OES84_04860, partial [Kiritimatiellaceae bacterium]|nr:hypothetical protein [Kiritimatiellaceae bacterium]